MTGQVQAQATTVSKTAPVAPKVNPIAISKPVSVDKPDVQADAKAAQKPAPQVLPADPVAPITSVKATPTATVQNEPGKSELGSNGPQPVKQTSSGSGTKSDVATVDPVAGAAKVGSQSKGGGSFGSSSRQSKQDKPSETPISVLATTSATKTGAVKAPTGVTELQGLDRTALVKQVADKMQAIAASRSKDGVIVQLAPKALGTITVTLKTAGSGMDAHLVASNDQVRKALEQSRPDLVQTMGNRGYKLTTVTVSQESASTTSGNKQQLPNQQRQSTQTRQTAVATNPSESVSTAMAADRPSSAQSAGVDLWI
jgi:flagellar hook-length control protein FliK